ncbi:MAG: isoprenylcysteine carboxylmethyltransferase family protein [Candidatus Pelagadaptatus aseana]|uniref:methyltransferase family protein n=1 Tax=Candidatus Pelagadaptatus aseana TaxID=3120508 RepID=UPI0039B1B58D
MNRLENRIPPPLVAVLFMLLSWLWDSDGTESVTMQGAVAAVVIVAVLIARASITGFIRAKTTVNPLKPESASTLVTTGIFGYSRNPMYVALALLVFAFSLYFTGYWSLLFTVAYVLYITRFQISPEERAMEKLFGEEFVDYKGRVRRWL